MFIEAYSRETWDQALTQFAERDAAYLDTAARGLLPRSSMAAVVRHLEDLAAGATDKAALFETVERVRARFARLIGCEPDEVAFTKNISEGINIIAGALPWSEGDNLVLCSGVEHPANIYPWLNLQGRSRIEIRDIASTDGRLPVEAMAEAVDARTRLVTLSTVTFSPGLRANFAPLVAACRAYDAFLLADGAQSIGILETDVEKLGLDGLVASAQKGLLGLYGIGFLYCRRAWAERMSPIALSRFGVNLGSAHEASTSTVDYRLMPGARRFDIGNYNYPAAVACEHSLGLLISVGTAAIEAHATGLARQTAAGLSELALPVFGGNYQEVGSDLASIVTVGFWGAGGHDTTDDPAMAAFAEALMQAGVRFSLRRGLIRLAFHVYNTEADVERVIAVARRFDRVPARRREGLV